MDITLYNTLRRRHLSTKQDIVLMIGTMLAYGVQVFLKKKCPDVSEVTIKIVTVVIMAVTVIIAVCMPRR